MNKKIVDGLKRIEDFWSPQSYRAFLEIIQGLVEMAEAKPEFVVESGWTQATAPEPTFEPNENFIYRYPSNYGCYNYFMFRTLRGNRYYIELDDMDTFKEALTGEIDNDVLGESGLYDMDAFHDEYPEAVSKAVSVMDISGVELL